MTSWRWAAIMVTRPAILSFFVKLEEVIQP